MSLEHLIVALSKPDAYPVWVARVEVVQTHISAVFLAGAFVYKVKKPVNLGFLDFSTLEKRKFYCEEEVRLNRRLAADVYLGVVPIVETASGVRIEGYGPPIEWAVKMQRLPAGQSLRDKLLQGDLDQPLVERLARKLAGFHEQADSGPQIAAGGRYEVVAGNARENFEQSMPQVGGTVSREVFDRLWLATQDALNRLRPLIESRALRGVPRDTHGDLHLDHIYHFPNRQPPADLIAIDCIEFNERYRIADPIADSAFLAMDLIFHNRRDLANAFVASYLEARNDPEARDLLPFYMAYRAMVRAKVDGIESLEVEVPDSERAAARMRARGHWLLASGELEPPSARPSLVLVGGLPGSGKSTLAAALSAHCGFAVIRSDVVRKKLAGIDPNSSARQALNTGIYTPEWTEHIYSECLRECEQLLFEGKRVIVDASFACEAHRRTFLDLAARMCVPSLQLVCHTDREVAIERVRNRHGDASDADVETYQHAASRWEAAGDKTRKAWHEIDANSRPEDVLESAMAVLRGKSLL